MTALLCVATACDITPNGGLDGKVAIIFSTTTSNEEGDDEVLRSAGAEKAETQTVSLGGDLYLSATLRPVAAAADELRATAAEPGEGQKVCLLVHTAGTNTLVDSVLYIYTGGQLVAGKTFSVDPGTYDFTAYSYYNSTETPATANIDPAKDLVWGQQTKEITAGDQTVTIVMKHLFAKVTGVVLKTGIANATL
jgi:hypothetical protein